MENELVMTVQQMALSLNLGGVLQGANLLVASSGRIKLADFGASRKIEELASCGEAPMSALVTCDVFIANTCGARKSVCSSPG